MRITRWIIERTTAIACRLKKHRKVSVNGHSGPVKVNLGSGLAVAPGWINVDGSLNAMFASWPRFVHRILYRLSGVNRYYSEKDYCDLVAGHDFVHHNLAYGLPFRDSTADFLYSSHFLEHLSKNDGEHFLRECFRVIQPGGVLRLCVPDLEYAVGLYGSGKKADMLDNYFFVRDRGSVMAEHKYMYDWQMLKSMLDGLGFKDVSRRSFAQGRTPDLDVLDNRPEDTLFVEAEK